MNLTPLELVVLRYIQGHPMTRRSTIVESLSYGDWEAAHRIRITLDSLVARQIIQKAGTGVRNVRYAMPATKEAA